MHEVMSFDNWKVSHYESINKKGFDNSRVFNSPKVYTSSGIRISQKPFHKKGKLSNLTSSVNDTIDGTSITNYPSVGYDTLMSPISIKVTEKKQKLNDMFKSFKNNNSALDYIANVSPNRY